jgi:hypothetical protein
MTGRDGGWRLRRWVAVACLVVAAALPALAQDRQRHAGLPGTTDAMATTPIGAWRTITLGPLKSPQAYRQALDAVSIRIGDSANEILGRPAFSYQKVKTAVELVLVSAGELGLAPGAASLADVYGRARQVGLHLCPAHVGLQLRLDYADQPIGEFVHVAMEPVATYAGQPTILALANGWRQRPPADRQRWAVRFPGDPQRQVRVCAATIEGARRADEPNAIVPA